MSNERNILRGMKQVILRTPSILSKNRTVLAILAFMYLIPLGTGAALGPVRNLLKVVTLIMIFALLAMSFDLQLGRSALLNFGHVALFGVGAYFVTYTLDENFLPSPYNAVAAIPYPLAILIAMLIGAGLGLIMGLTTSRMRGTAFAFIALAIAMFIFNFFRQTNVLSGGETGIRVPIPDLLRTGPVYQLFVMIAFIFLAAFVGTTYIYLKKKMDYTGLLLVVPVIAALTGFLLILGRNILGSVVVVMGFLIMIMLFLFEYGRTIDDPLQYSEHQTLTGDVKSRSMVSTYVIPLVIVVVIVVGVLVSFGENISDMMSLWITQDDIFYFRTPVQYYLVLTCLVLIYVFVRRLIASPFGRMVTAVAQNEERAEALGYNSYRAKIVVLVISGAIASLAGALYAPFINILTPETALGVEITINAMLYTIIGGIATLFGPILGTGVVVYSEHNLVDFFEGLGLPGRLWLIGLGVMYIIIVLFMPLGIVGSLGHRIDSFKVRLRQFGLRESDYWIFGLLGTMGILLYVSEDPRLFPLALGIFGFLIAVGFFLVVVLRRNIWSGLKAFGRRSILRLTAIGGKIKSRLQRR
ncbi:MAG: branched-chain amino acid ABC transporter permease [Candidatus Thorarchaeota archaeon]